MSLSLRTRKAAAGLLLALLVVTAPATASEGADAPKIDPKAEEVLRRMSGYYAGLQAVEFRVTVESSMQKAGQDLTMKTVHAVAYDRPNRFRFTLEEGETGATSVSDGKNLYIYLASLKKYAKERAPRSLAALTEDSPQLALAALGQNMVLQPILDEDPYAVLTADASAIEYAGQVEEDGESYHRIRFDRGERQSEYHIASGDRPAVRRIHHKLVSDDGPPGQGKSDIQIAVLLDDWKTDGVLPEDAFAFDPPPGVSQIPDRRSSPGGSQLGNTAPLFALELLEGGTVDLADLMGDKVVVLDFFATWCGPCRIGLPVLDTVYQDYQDKDVAFYAVNLAESPGMVRSFWEGGGYQFPVLMDARQKVKGLYGVNTIPRTFVIGKDGTIQSIHYGPAPEADLRHELETLLAGNNLVD